MLEAMTTWAGLAALLAAGGFLAIVEVLRERAVGDDGSTDPPGRGRSFAGVVIGVALAVAVVSMIVRFDELT